MKGNCSISRPAPPVKPRTKKEIDKARKESLKRELHNIRNDYSSAEVLKALSEVEEERA